MGKHYHQHRLNRVVTRSFSNIHMVESFGTDNYRFNQVEDSEFFGGQGQNPGEMHSHFGGKAKRGGVGGKNSKSKNFKEQKNANKRRFEKIEREENRA